MKTSFKPRVLRMGLGGFVDINILVIKYFSFGFFTFFIFVESLKSKSTQMLRPQEGNSGVSFNDTLYKSRALQGKTVHFTKIGVVCVRIFKKQVIFPMLPLFSV